MFIIVVLNIFLSSGGHARFSSCDHFCDEPGSSLYQFWQQTEYIKRLHPAIEYIFVTPSSHRVHHGSQQKYINKNFGATVSCWDRMFGTYQREGEKPVYGITHSLGRVYDRSI